MSILYISTHVDEVMDILRTRHSMELKELAEIVGLPEAKVEGWCNILEEKGFIRLEHHLTKVWVHWQGEKKFSLLKGSEKPQETITQDYDLNETGSWFASVKEEVERTKQIKTKRK